ncbi:hypothetical protein PFISCL1PPCAC_2127, partial [Pristionchus fissidentatus]
SGCCIPKGMDPNEMLSGLPLRDSNGEQLKTEKKSEWEHLRGIVADYVIDNCGPAFACDNVAYRCSDKSKCINPSGEMLSGCCIPENMDPNEIERGLTLADSANEKEQRKRSEWEHLRGIVADYVIDNCGPAFACDNHYYGCDDKSKCINPSGEMLSGCCIPKNMDPTEIGKGLPLVLERVESVIGKWEFGTLNGIDLTPLIAPYVLAPKKTKQEQLQEVGSICSPKVGQCIPTVFIANVTKFH